MLLGFALVFSPERSSTTSTGAPAPTWGNLAIAIPVAMLAYTGVETVSNLAEEAREPQSSVPNAIHARRARSLRDLLHPAAGGAVRPAGEADRRRADDAARAAARARAGTPTTRSSGSWTTSASRAALLDTPRGLRRRARRHDPRDRHERGHHRRLADHVLDGDLPADARGVPQAAPPAQDAVHRARAVRGHRADRPPAARATSSSSGTLYSLGATLSFTVAHAAMVAATPHGAGPRCDLPGASERLFRGVEWPVFAVFGGLATGASRSS